MSNIEIILVVLMALGFGYVITKLNKIYEVCSVIITLLVKDNINITFIDEEEG